jgi:hypothetical protein
MIMIIRAPYQFISSFMPNEFLVRDLLWDLQNRMQPNNGIKLVVDIAQ